MCRCENRAVMIGSCGNPEYRFDRIAIILASANLFANRRSAKISGEQMGINGVSDIRGCQDRNKNIDERSHFYEGERVASETTRDRSYYKWKERESRALSQQPCVRGGISPRIKKSHVETSRKRSDMFNYARVSGGSRQRSNVIK